MNSSGVPARPKAGFFSSLDMRRLRQLHLYLGVFFAPAIIFFAFSGALQTFSLHEGGHGSSYEPPAWIVTIASIHKDQRLPRARAGGRDPGVPQKVKRGGEAEHGKGPSGPSPLPLKIFVLCLAIGLISSALLGITIALRNRATRRISLIMLVLGAGLPVFLLLI